jgi:hypothetical protein
MPTRTERDARLLNWEEADVSWGVLILLVTVLAYSLLLTTFGVEIGVVPPWAQ